MRLKSQIVCCLLLFMGGCEAENKGQCLSITECQRGFFCIDGTCQTDVANNNINDDRLHFNILNAQGDKLCIEPREIAT